MVILQGVRCNERASGEPAVAAIMEQTAKVVKNMRLALNDYVILLSREEILGLAEQIKRAEASKFGSER